MTQILIINCFKRDDYAQDFDTAISRKLRRSDFYALRMTALTEEFDISPFSHLIISGSETSALDDYSWTAALEILVKNWVKKRKPVLGICYGHQFLARVLAGISYVRRAKIPEFGWADVSLEPCTLFGDVPRLKAMVSHYDEVISLPTDFTVLAATVQCGIHAFQYLDLPVWGLQFHPEYGLKEAEFIFQQVRKSDPEAGKWFIGDAPQADDLKDCQRIFDNFLTL